MKIKLEKTTGLLSVSADDPWDEGERPILLWVPNPEKEDHEHITLTPDGAKELGEWLIDWWCQWANKTQQG